MWLSEVDVLKCSKDDIKNILFSFPDDDFQCGDYIWVFGSMIDLEERVLEAIRLYFDHRASKIIFSGGNGEAILMKEKAIDSGVKEEDIFIEQRSLSTIENVLFTMVLLYREEVLNLMKHVIVVTSSVHMKRVFMTLEKYMFKGVTFSYACPKYSKYNDVDGEYHRIYDEVRELILKVKEGYLDDIWVDLNV